MVDVGTSGPTRRKALWLMGAVGLVALGADDVRHSPSAVAQSRRPTPVPPPTPSASPSPTPTPKPVPVVRPAPWTPEKLTATVQPLRHLPEIAPAPPVTALALTIDDGPDPDWTPQILDLLAEHQVKASFFMISEMAREYPKLARRVADAGHQVSNHSRTHPLPFDSLSPKRLRTEIVDAQKEIADITGVLPALFRAPGGGWSKRAYTIMGDHGMLPVDWSIDPSDWKKPGARSIRRSMLQSKAGDIILCHDGGGDRSQTVAALRTVVPTLKRRGLAFTAL
ncbi:polysaccharide deacetylase family protein [Actinomadura hibisca]|uniref:polysaccharide deacetylase family protein n=1 Tax=Actinomadura hibisca TaxID=68565 RepID=UPI000A504380|nr:polysaccharide deacetylase family protein [Actinomadura hibisca]